MSSQKLLERRKTQRAFSRLVDSVDGFVVSKKSPLSMYHWKLCIMFRKDAALVELLNNPSKVGKRVVCKIWTKRTFMLWKTTIEEKRFKVKVMHDRRKCDVKKSLVPIRWCIFHLEFMTWKINNFCDETAILTLVIG